jgi:hypothetical protein
MNRILLILSVLVFTSACVNGNVCQRRLEFEEEECFSELEQPTFVENEDCFGDDKAYSKCAMRNQDAYCDYFLWQNRGPARREGYTVSDYLAPGNEFVQCIDEEGLREQ